MQCRVDRDNQLVDGYTTVAVSVGRWAVIARRKSQGNVDGNDQFLDSDDATAVAVTRARGKYRLRHNERREQRENAG